jgi:hypothetical protein
VLGGGGLEERAVDRCLEVDGQQAAEDLLRLGLVDEVALERDLVSALLLVLVEERPRDREDVLHLDVLRERRDVVVVDHHHAVDLTLEEEVGELVGDRLRVVVGRPVGEVHPGLLDVVAAEAKGRASLLADDGPADVRARPAELALEREGATDDLRVEGPGQPAISGQRQDGDRAHVLAGFEQREPTGRCRPRRADHELAHALGVGAHRLDARLRAAQLRGGDELHRLGDLARVPDGAEAPLDVLDGGHS